MQTPSENKAQAALLLWAESLPYCTGFLYRPDMPKYTRKSKFLADAHIFTNSCENSKILSRLLSVLSLSWKFVYDHYCCPISAIILTTPKLEAILDFWRGCWKTFPNEMGGGPLVSASLPARAVRAQIASGYTAGDTISCYQSSVSFLLFQHSLYRSGLGGSR